MRRPLASIFPVRLNSTVALLALCACSAADQATGYSPIEGADRNAKPSLARRGSSPVSRPLAGRCTTVVTRLVPPPIEVQRIEYTCRISHLGLTHAVVTQTIDVATGALSSSGVFVAANGDQLSSNFTGVAVLSFTDPTDASVTFEGTEKFSPGTGRFAAANGTAELVGSARTNLITGAATGEFTLEGRLAY
jgi:hypothetical protein